MSKEASQISNAHKHTEIPKLYVLARHNAIKPTAQQIELLKTTLSNHDSSQEL